MSRDPNGAKGAKIGTNAPMRNPVGGINPMKPLQRK
jgi:hypothetical protein